MRTSGFKTIATWIAWTAVKFIAIPLFGYMVCALSKITRSPFSHFRKKVNIPLSKKTFLDLATCRSFAIEFNEASVPQDATLTKIDSGVGDGIKFRPAPLHTGKKIPIMPLPLK
jgi:hypothetical protein